MASDEPPLKKRDRWASDSEGSEPETSKKKQDKRSPRKKKGSSSEKSPAAAVVTEREPTPEYSPDSPDAEQSSSSSNNNVVDESSSAAAAGATTAGGKFGDVERRRHPLLDGCRSVDAFERLDRIEEGSYGVVYRARDVESNEIVALKRVKLSREACVDGFPITALRETNVLLALQHENIVRVREMVVGREHDKVFMVMEYFDHDLKSCIERHEGPFSQAEVKSMFLQLVAGIEHMHSRWFIHRDIKTSNLLYSNQGKLSICDFGLARRYGDPVAPYTRNVVTLWYRCPELLLGTKEYACGVDNWSVGCVFAELLLKKPLFVGKSEIEQLSEIFKVLGSPNDDRWPGYSELPHAATFKWKAQKRSKLRDRFPVAGFGGSTTTPLTDGGLDLLSRLLSLDPDSRIDAKAALAHDYFREFPPPTPKHQMPTFPLKRI